MTRIRSRATPGVTGYAYDNGIYNHHTSLSSIESCEDEVIHSGGILIIDKRVYSGGIVNGGPVPPSGNNRTAFNATPLALRDGSETGHLSIPGVPTDAATATTVLAKSNPSRPVVDLPTAVFELKDLPSLFKNQGDTLIKKGAGLNLKYQFGIKPLISDLKSLLLFQHHVAHREKELRNLQESGLRRKVVVFSGSASSQKNRLINSSLYSKYAELTRTTQVKKWGFVEYKPSSYPVTDAQLRRLAMRAVLGLTIDFSTAWNVIPWSWLVDWCSNVGDFLIANRNLVPCTHGQVLVMEHTKTEVTARDAGGHHKMTPWKCVRETKTRKPVSASLSAQLPFLSGRQLSILGSIKALR